MAAENASFQFPGHKGGEDHHRLQAMEMEGKNHTRKGGFFPAASLAVLFTFGLILLFFTSGCALFQSKQEKTAKELAAIGMEKFEKKKYKDALEAFQRLKDFYPFSKYAILAELKIGDTHYRRKDYAEAVDAYEEFENLHPQNEATPYVIYQIGRCYFEQMESIDRDQKATRKAMDKFTRVKNLYPDSPYAEKASEHINTCLNNLVGHERYVGRFYYKSKHYRAALKRYHRVLNDFPDIDGSHENAREYIKRCEDALGE